MIAKPPSILDRTKEWDALEACWERDRAELIFVVGRRRVGKSHLLAPFALATGGLYYQATRRTDAEQLASLSREVGRVFDDAALFYPPHGARDRLRAYWAFGGVAGNLALLDPDCPLADNIAAYLLDPTARLFD